MANTKSCFSHGCLKNGLIKSLLGEKQGFTLQELNSALCRAGGYSNDQRSYTTPLSGVFFVTSKLNPASGGFFVTSKLNPA